MPRRLLVAGCWWLAASGLLAQQGAGPFRPGNNTPTQLPPTIPQKGPAWYPGRIAFIDSQGLLDGLTGTATNCVLIDGSSQPCNTGGGGSGGGGYFTGSETPGGAINGSNAVFTLLNAPSPAASLLLMKNGLVLKATVDYTLAGATITFLSAAIPAPPDSLQAWYNVAGSMGGVSLTGTPSVGYVPTATGATTATWQAPAPGGVWGQITGTLSSQTDLETALGTFLAKANNLSDVASASAARTNLGLGTAAAAALVTSVGSPGSNTNVPSEEAVATALAAIQTNGQQALEYWFCTKDTVQGNWGNGGARFVGLTITGDVDDNPCFYSFPSDGTGYAVVHHLLPPTWSSTAGTNLTVYWSQNSGGTGNVQWNVSTVCAAAGAGVYNNAPTYNAAQSQTVAAPSGDNLAITTFTALTQTGCAAGDFLYVKIQNTASGSGGTTYASPVDVFGVAFNQNGLALTGSNAATAVYVAPAVATVATLPASPVTNQVVPISDGAAASDCTTGSGTVAHSCQWNGSAWVAYYTQRWVMFVTGNQAIGASTTVYGSAASPAFGASGFGGMAVRQSAIGSACHLSATSVTLLSAQGASTMTLTVYKNGSAGSPTVTVAPSATQGTVISDTTDSADFLPTDLLAVQAANGAGAASAYFSVSLVCQL